MGGFSLSERQGRRLPSRVWVALLVLATAFVPGKDAYSYLFWNRLRERNAPDYRPGATDAPVAKDALRWSTDAWGSGGMLEWVIDDSPAWTEPLVRPGRDTEPSPFADASEAVPYVARALAAWSVVETADIRWELRGVAADVSGAQDSRNSVRIDPEREGGANVDRWIVRGEIVACDVNLSQEVAHRIDRRAWAMSTLIHELGHCIGLRHSAVFPTWDSFGYLESLPAVWPNDPHLAYGTTSIVDLTHDDAVGASLLRPVPGWRDTTGSIHGEVTLDGAPARFVPVYATRITGPAGYEAVSVFSNEVGRFTLEGLAPGEYQLVIGSLLSTGHGGFIRDGASIEGRDRYLLTPVTVEIGGETRVPRIALTRGRAASP